MNKRIRNKQDKRRNRQRCDEVLKSISKHFKIVSKTYLDGYFIFSHGNSSVCHFKLKETPFWLYGLWVGKDGFQLFGEHFDLVDKFKPSRTYVSTTNSIDEFLSKVKEIQEEPKFHFINSMNYGQLLDVVNVNGESYFDFQVIRERNPSTGHYDLPKLIEPVLSLHEYVEREWDIYKEKGLKRFDDEVKDKKYTFDFFKELPTLFDEIKCVCIRDGNKDGWIQSPRFDIEVILKKGVEQNRLDEVMGEVEWLINKKSDSNEIRTHEYDFSLSGFYYEEFKKYDYKYV